jgi:hypothetical protein
MDLQLDSFCSDSAGHDVQWYIGHLGRIEIHAKVVLLETSGIVGHFCGSFILFRSPLKSVLFFFLTNIQPGCVGFKNQHRGGTKFEEP